MRLAPVDPRLAPQADNQAKPSRGHTLRQPADASQALTKSPDFSIEFSKAILNKFGIVPIEEYLPSFDTSQSEF
jgi:hypothetical protein